MAKKTNNAVLDMLQSKYPGYHPLMAIADIAHNPDPNIEWELRFQCHKAIAKYVEPELKSVQTIDGNKRPDITITMFGESNQEEEIIDVVGHDRPLVTVK